MRSVAEIEKDIEKTERRLDGIQEDIDDLMDRKETVEIDLCGLEEELEEARDAEAEGEEE